MITRTEKVRLGIFLVISTTIAVVAFIVLAGIKLLESVDTYSVPFTESVSGLEIGAQVKYNGVRVGQVSKINIDTNNLHSVNVILELHKGTPVKTNTKAVLVGMGITGLKFVELTGGTDSAPLLPPGGTIQSGHSFMGKLEGKAEDIAVKIEMALGKINTILNEKNLAYIDEIVANVQDITANLSVLLEDNRENLTVLLTNLSQTSGDLTVAMASAKRSMRDIEEIIETNSPKVSTLFDDATEVASSFKKTAKDLAKVDNILRKTRETLEKFASQLEKVDVAKIAKGIENTVHGADATVQSIRRVVDASRANVYQSSKHLKNTLRNLEDLSSELREQPSLLLNSDPPERRTPNERR